MLVSGIGGMLFPFFLIFLRAIAAFVALSWRTALSFLFFLTPSLFNHGQALPEHRSHNCFEFQTIYFASDESTLLAELESIHVVLKTYPEGERTLTRLKLFDQRNLSELFLQNNLHLLHYDIFVFSTTNPDVVITHMELYVRFFLEVVVNFLG